jgi:hypothetical protein
MSRLAFPVLALLLLASLLARSQRRHDPLEPAEIDQLRDTAVEPENRLKLYVKFARARLDTLDQARAAAPSPGRGKKTHDAIEDFLSVYDELNDNIDNFVGRDDDIRKPLKDIIAGDTEFQSRLRAIRDAAHVKPEEYQQYEYVLTNTIETVDGGADDHRKTLADQEELAKKKKLHKPE